MILADKIAALRKKEGWSQEELAEKLGISRQSVSKWEGSASIPDIDKIIMMSELFNVSTDYLLKDKMEEPLPAENSAAEEAAVLHSVSLEEAGDFMNLTRKYAGFEALAVALFVLCPTPLILLAGLAEYGRISMSEEVAGSLGVAVLLIMVAAGVAVLNLCESRLSKYDYLKEEGFTLRYGVQGITEKNKEMFSGAFRVSMTVGVALCILGALPILLGRAMGADELAMVCCVDAMLGMIAAAVFLFVWADTIQGSFHKLLQVEKYSPRQKEMSKRTKLFASAYWCVVTAVFLAAVVYFRVSFMDNEGGDIEYPNMLLGIIWPVAALLFAAVKKILYAVIIKKN